MAGGTTRRVWRWPLLALVLLGALLVGAWLLRPAPPLTVEVVAVERGEVQELIPSAAAGEVRAARRVTVRAELAGTVAAVLAQRGSRVEGEAVVVRFSSDDLEARLAQARANLEAAAVTVRIAETRAATTQRALDRAKKLRSNEAISEVELERIETEDTAARQAIEQAKAARAQAQAALELAQVTKAKSVVRAPFPGVLQDVQAEVGVQLAPGAPLFELLDDSAVKVDLPIDEADVPRVALDQTVLLYLGGRREHPLLGRLSFIPPAIGRAGGAGLEAALPQKDRALYVEVTPSEDGRLKIGASVNAEVLVSARSDVPWVPTQVVIGRGRERSVYRLEGNRIRKVNFEAGLTSWERTEVKSGLAIGDRVVSSLNVKGLEDGLRVVVKGEPQRP